MKNDVDVELGEFQLLEIFYSTEILLWCLFISRIRWSR